MTKPKIVVIPDKPGWAYEVIAKALIDRLPEYDWHVRYAGDINEINRRHADWDLIFAMGWKWPKRDIKTPRQKTISVVHSFRTLDGGSIESWGRYIDERYCVIGAVNLRLAGLIGPACQANLVYVPNGVDAHRFAPCLDMRPTEGPLVAAWSGLGNDPEFRGVPIMREAAAAAGVHLHVHSASRGHIRHSAMAAYYNMHDLYLCMSKSEGCSLSMLEAASCGLPCICTDTGVAREMIPISSSQERVGFIVERSAIALTDCLVSLDRKRCLEMGAAMRESIVRAWTWEKQVPKWKHMIDLGLEHSNG